MNALDRWLQDNSFVQCGVSSALHEVLTRSKVAEPNERLLLRSWYGGARDRSNRRSVKVDAVRVSLSP